MARSWYGYLGSGDTTDPGNYLRSNVAPTCLSGNTICSVYAYGTSLFPAAFSSRILQYIADANVGTTPRPIAPGAKFYLYKLG